MKRILFPGALFLMVLAAFALLFTTKKAVAPGVAEPPPPRPEYVVSAQDLADHLGLPITQPTGMGQVREIATSCVSPIHDPKRPCDFTIHYASWARILVQTQREVEEGWQAELISSYPYSKVTLVEVQGHVGAAREGGAGFGYRSMVIWHDQAKGWRTSAAGPIDLESLLQTINGPWCTLAVPLGMEPSLPFCSQEAPLFLPPENPREIPPSTLRVTPQELADELGLPLTHPAGGGAVAEIRIDSHCLRAKGRCQFIMYYPDGWDLLIRTGTVLHPGWQEEQLAIDLPGETRLVTVQGQLGVGREWSTTGDALNQNGWLSTLGWLDPRINWLFYLEALYDLDTLLNIVNGPWCTLATPAGEEPPVPFC